MFKEIWNSHKKECIIVGLLLFVVIKILSTDPIKRIRESKDEKRISQSVELVDDCKKLCAKKKWKKAYSVVQEIREKSEKAYGWTAERKCKSLYEEAKKYVILQESLCIIEENGSNGLMRIIGIAKEQDAEGWLYPELIDVAIKIDDEDLVHALLRQDNASIYPSLRIIEYLYIGKDDNNINYLIQWLGRLNLSENLLKLALENDDIDLMRKLSQKFSGSLSVSTFSATWDHLLSRWRDDYKIIIDALMTKVEDKEELIILCIEKDDVTMVKDVAQQISGSLSMSVFKAITDFLLLKEGNISNPLINTLTAKVEDKFELIKYLIEKNYDSDMIFEVANGVTSSSKLLQISPDLLKVNASKASNVIVNSLTKMQPTGSAPLLGQEYERYSYKYVKTYIAEVNTYNNQCHNMLDLAISCHNRNLAQRIVSLMKSSYKLAIEWSSLETLRIDREFDKSAITEAKKKLQEAIRTGQI